MTLFEIYLALAFITGSLYTYFIYIEYFLERDINRVGAMNSKIVFKFVIAIIFTLLVWVITIMLAPLVWVDAVLGNLIPKEQKIEYKRKNGGSK